MKAFALRGPFYFISITMKHNEVLFDCKARYYKLGSINKATRQIWFVLHGYGQLAQYFIQKFKSLEAHNICVIAPEGLSHFYLKETETRMHTGDTRVGATWMTKENRMVDIENYLRYLNILYQQEIINTNTIPISILGFSQGAATASRWITDGKVKFERLILWAGVFPPDMNFESANHILKEKQTYWVYGKSDPFLNDSRLEEMNSIASKLEITPTLIAFDGKHDIDTETLTKFI